ncbi:hypothetical protein D3C72_1218390 [compost metagenome]
MKTKVAMGVFVLLIIGASSWLIKSSVKGQQPMQPHGLPVQSDEYLRSNPVIEREQPAPAQDLQVAEMLADKKYAEAERLHEELSLDLREIQQRRLVEALNDPRTNPAVKEEALRFMGEYLRKLTSYMKMRNQQVQAMMERNNG